MAISEIFIHSSGLSCTLPLYCYRDDVKKAVGQQLSARWMFIDAMHERTLGIRLNSECQGLANSTTMRMRRVVKAPTTDHLVDCTSHTLPNMFSLPQATQIQGYKAHRSI